MQKEESTSEKGMIIAGIVLIIINLICLIGPIFVRNKYEVLWLSHYAGLLQGILLLYLIRKPHLNGAYVFLFIFQICSFLLNISTPLPAELDWLHIFYFLNHIPHFFGFWMIAKKDYSIRGLTWGLIFFQFIIILSWYISFVYSQEFQHINTTFSDSFIIVYLFGFGWYGILFLLA